MDDATRQVVEKRIVELEQSLAVWRQEILQAQRQIERQIGALAELRRLLESSQVEAHNTHPERGPDRFMGHKEEASE